MLPSSFRSGFQKYFGFSQDYGLLFQNKQLRFISFHKDHLHWSLQLGGLINTFDIASWSLLVSMVIILSQMAKFTRINLNRTMTFTYAFFICASMLDQSSAIFSNSLVRRIARFHVYFLWVPIMFFYLSNLYKGDNITVLTLGPPLIPFDAFENLVKSNFKITVPSVILPENLYKSRFVLKEKPFQKTEYFFAVIYCFHGFYILRKN